ncbi:MAG: hypothetical protein DMF84_25950 [Acidobacteria bacterium]|nr:MAG: hypothetical protein DMF84_25950 [Acidobacteriota bacterium]
MLANGCSDSIEDFDVGFRYRAHANHLLISRLPSRRQPFRFQLWQSREGEGDLGAVRHQLTEAFSPTLAS